MTDLKTYEELKIRGETIDSKGRKLVSIREPSGPVLKKEAIEWIKYLQTMENSEKTIPDDFFAFYSNREMESDNVINWVKYFFNIKDEELVN